MCAKNTCTQRVIKYKRGLNPTCLFFLFFKVLEDFFKHIALRVLLDMIGCHRMFPCINGIHVRDEVDCFPSLRRHNFSFSRCTGK